jgi:hypothetical protein
VKFLGVDELHAAFLNESRTQAVGSYRVQEIPASRSFFARCGIPPRFPLTPKPSMQEPQVPTLRSGRDDIFFAVDGLKSGRMNRESEVKERWNPTSREKRARYGAPVLR